MASDSNVHTTPGTPESSSAVCSEADLVLHYLVAGAHVVAQSLRLDRASTRDHLRDSKNPHLRTSRPVVAAAPYEANSKFQAASLQPRARNYSFSETWSEDDSLKAELSGKAAAVVRQHFAAISRDEPGQDANLARIGHRSFVLSSPDALMLHVWENRAEATCFHEALRRVAQAKLDHMISAPIHVPIAVLVVSHGLAITAAWLPPLYSDPAFAPDKRSASWMAIDVLRASLHLRRTDAVALNFGADCRYYVTVPPSVVLHHQDPFNSAALSSAKSSDKYQPMKRRPTVRYEIFDDFR
jgi:hypothetical protein